MWWRVRRFGGELLGRLKQKKRNIDYTGESNFLRFTSLAKGNRLQGSFIIYTFAAETFILNKSINV